MANPSPGGWVEVLHPVLSLNPSTDPDRDLVHYEFEVFADNTLATPVASGSSFTTTWTVPKPLVDNTAYFWRARAVDSTGRSSPWSEASSFFINEDGRNDPPTLKVIPPAQTVQQEAGEVMVTWIDDDPDSAAKVSIFANSILLRGSIAENEDGLGDSYLIPLSRLTAGTYTIEVEIDDGGTKVSATAPGKIVIPDPKQYDADGDGINDAKDNCPRRSNRDIGGILKGSLPDKKGDACQCGDVDNDGVVTDQDAKEIEKLFTRPFKKSPSFASEKCDVGATPGCSLLDAVVIRAYVVAAETYRRCQKKDDIRCGQSPRIPDEREAAR